MVKVKEWKREKTHHVKTHCKTLGMAIVILDKTDFKTKKDNKINNDKGVNYF